MRRVTSAATGLRTELLDVRQILLALPHPSLVALLILGANESVRATAALGDRVQVTPCIPDRLFDVLAMRLGRLEYPGLVLGVGQEAGELGATLALAADGARSLPVLRGLQRLCRAD